MSNITSFLDEGDPAIEPAILGQNADRAFQGSNVLGLGFTLAPDEARSLINKNARNAEVLFPYLIGEDLNSSPDCSASRWIINFYDWPLARNSNPSAQIGPVAADYADCLRIVEDRVKPQRMLLAQKPEPSAQGYARYWWQYARKGIALYRSITDLDHVICCTRTSVWLIFALVERRQVFADRLVVVASEDFSHFATLMSNIHGEWAWKFGSTIRNSGIIYNPTRCFETFPFPEPTKQSCATGDSYHRHRSQLMKSNAWGLTDVYNRLHDSVETSADIQKLRRLHAEMDTAVAAAYGWTDLDLGHGFHETKQGVRYTISEPARREVLARLLKLNHERYAEEVAKGLHEKKKGKKGLGARGRGAGKKSRAGAGESQNELFGGE